MAMLPVTYGYAPVSSDYHRKKGRVVSPALIILRVRRSPRYSIGGGGASSPGFLVGDGTSCLGEDGVEGSLGRTASLGPSILKFHFRYNSIWYTGHALPVSQKASVL